jgi:cardiolipin synthase
MDTVLALLVGFGWPMHWGAALLLVGELLALLTIPSVLIRRRGHPTAALAWLLALLAVPLAGVVLWWGIGRTHLVRKRRRRVSAHLEITRGLADVRAGTGRQEMVELLPLHRVPVEEAVSVFPPVSGNRVEVLVDGAAVYEAIERAVIAARHHVHFLFYAWRADSTGRRLLEAVVGAARHGVQVRVLCDALGSWGLSRRFLAPLVDAGGRVAFFMPTRFLRRSLTLNFRNHRKLVVVDGRVGYTGGVNIGDEYTKNWRDLGVMLSGPVVAQLQEVFADDWFFATGENLAAADFFAAAGMRPPEGERSQPAWTEAVCAIVAGGPDTRFSTTHDSLFIAINRARRRILITTPYLVPGPAMLAALRTAAFRGVDVQLLVPRRSDVPFTYLAGRSYYPDLLSGGVRVFEYLKGTLHSKLWLFDDDLSVVGSANLDTRSFRMNFEISCWILARAVNERLAALFVEDRSASEEVTIESVQGAGRVQQLKEAVVNLLSPLL